MKWISLLVGVLLGFPGSGGGGGGEQQTTTVTKSDPWAGQQEYLLDVFKKAKEQYDSGTPSYYPGRVSAGPTGETIAAQQNLTSAAGDQQQIAQQAKNAYDFGTSAVMNPGSNPYLQQYIQGAVDPIYQNYQRNILPGLNSQAIASGAYGGARNGLAIGQAAGDTSRAAANTSGAIMSQAYGQNLDFMGKTLAMTGQIQDAQIAPGRTLDAVGQQKQAYEQTLIDDAIQKWNFEQNLPAAKLAQYQGLVQGNYGGSASGTSTAPGAKRNTAMSALGGAAMGASIGSVVPGVGTAVGAGLGALMAFL